MKLVKVNVNLNESLEAMIFDELQAIRHMLSGKKHGKPEWISKKIIRGNNNTEKRNQYESFASPEEFQARWKRLAGA